MDSRLGIASLGTVTLGAAGGMAGSLLLTVASVIVTPAGPLTLERGQQQQFTSTVNGGARQEVFWWCSRGTITQAGLYAAPADYTQDAAAEVRAYAAADWSQYGLVSLSIEPRRYLLSGFTNGPGYQRLYESDDGLNFRPVPLANSMLEIRDPDIIYWSGAWYVATGRGNDINGQGGFRIYQSSDLLTWTLYRDIILGGSAWRLSWAPTWFVDPADGSLHIIINLSVLAWKDNMFIFETHPTAADMSTWSNPVLLWGGPGAYNCIYDARIARVGAKYRMLYKNHTVSAAPVLEWVDANTLTGVYTFRGTVAGGAGLYYGAPCQVLLPDGTTWRVFFDDYLNTWKQGSTKFVDSADDWATWGAVPSDIVAAELIKHAAVYEPPILPLPAPLLPPVPPAPPVTPSGSWPFGFFPSRWLSAYGGAR